MNDDMIDRAAALAAELQQRAVELQTTPERRQQAELSRMLETPDDKATLVQLTDRAFRSSQVSRIAEQFTHILDVQGIPRFFSPLDRAMMRGFQAFGEWLPGVSVPLVKEHMRHETANVVLPAEAEHLTQHLRARQSDGIRMNLNLLGEALLGEEEAQVRLEKYLAALQMPEVEVLSVKISTIYSQISPMAREHTLRVLCDRLELLYRAAAHHRFQRADGTGVEKFVYLDMEEYRDLHLTAEAFMRTLDRAGLKGVSAGIALQAYVPDSARVQRTINQWARRRVQNGGTPVTIRIVKGANMEMERVEAAQRDWPQAPFKSKAETDANYKSMLREALRPENLAAVRIGVASHNLFDVSYALVLAAAAAAGNKVQFEMLEGMANHQRRALVEQNRNLLLYAPACRREEFLHAIGYLIRRLDENTGPENFLSHAFKLTPGSEEWKMLEQGFRRSCRMTVSDAPRRTQDRNAEPFDEARPEMKWRELVNEPDTDWSLPQNSRWAESLVETANSDIEQIPLCVAEQAIDEAQAAHRKLSTCRDPSRPGAVVARYVEADESDVARAVACARADEDGWREMKVDARNEILGRVAHEIRRARGRLMRAAMLNAGKTLAESDPEVSEAVDFVEFYRASAREFFDLKSVRARGRGVVVVAPPWNFPIAIPCGGMAAALAAGNTVILKPSSDAVLVAWELCRCFWRGGVSRRALQFVPCRGDGAGTALVTHPDVDAVVLTGGTETARSMLHAKPEMGLLAETGGKNASIITALADRELAVRHVVHSAFSHSGQKCSATSLLLLEREIYDDAHFKRMFCDAVRSMAVGSALDLPTRVGPLIRPPRGELETALKTLEPGESWAVMPRPVGDNPNLWSPGVKWGVTRNSFTHLTELFGPVLAVMCFDSLDEAIDIVNETGFGLTSGLHTLDEREMETWKRSISAGNLYINRSTVGAIVLRQPFGGMGQSSFGPGMKAGGPNYAAQLMKFEAAMTPCIR
ncbi:MAG TPA: bifunctional proline dehydrogenase/L-glutamate gamma-semialdehyde dehydrogenase, partial [Verrucomicrobiaceae bacterium]